MTLEELTPGACVLGVLPDQPVTVVAAEYPLRLNNSGQTPAGVARLIGNYDVADHFADVETS